MSTSEYEKYLYLRKVEEVQQRANTNDYYHLIMAAGLLRHLLLDAAPLIHKANRDLRLNLRFEICPSPSPKLLGPPFSEALQWHIGGIDPTCWEETDQIEVVKEKDLLSTYCMTVKDHEFTVKDILQCCAYASGAIHLHTPTDREAALLSMDAIRIGGQPAVLKLLREIIAVVLKGLQPLTDAVASEFNAMLQQQQVQQNKPGQQE